MSVAVALEALKLSRDTWNKIPAKDKKRIIQAVKEKDMKTAVSLAAKYHVKYSNPCPKPIHCKKCGKAIKGTSGKPFSVRMAKLRSHRKRMHKSAHKKSVKKAEKTRKEKK